MFLRETQRPDFEGLPAPLAVVDLFSGCGGLSLGVAEGARREGRGIDVRLAVDFESRAAAVYQANFQKAQVLAAPVESFFDGAIGRRATRTELRIAKEVGFVDMLVGGPPCQGHSDLNNYTRRNDPRNAFYLRMARAAEVLRPLVVVIENVPTVRRDITDVVATTVQHLVAAGYEVAESVVDLSSLGVPQRRRRHIVVGVLEELASVSEIIDDIGTPCLKGRPRSVRWAIEDLEDCDSSPFDRTGTPSAENLKRMKWLHAKPDRYDLPNRLRPECHQGDHSYKAMYGRLNWDDPSPTITTGFGSMGQGRYVHPSRMRTITAHEAARLQMFPDYFDFGEMYGRGTWSKLIGNAVPPPLMVALARRVASLTP